MLTVLMTPYQVGSKVQMPSPTFKYLFGLYLSLEYCSVLYFIPRTTSVCHNAPLPAPEENWLFSCHPIPRHPLSLQCFSPFALLPQFIYRGTSSYSGFQKPFQISLLESIFSSSLVNAQGLHSILNWNLYEPIAGLQKLYTPHTLLKSRGLCLTLLSFTAPKCFPQDELLENLIANLANCLLLLC